MTISEVRRWATLTGWLPLLVAGLMGSHTVLGCHGHGGCQSCGDHDSLAMAEHADHGEAAESAATGEHHSHDVPGSCDHADCGFAAVPNAATTVSGGADANHWTPAPLPLVAITTTQGHRPATSGELLLPARAAHLPSCVLLV